MRSRARMLELSAVVGVLVLGLGLPATARPLNSDPPAPSPAVPSAELPWAAAELTPTMPVTEPHSTLSGAQVAQVPVAPVPTVLPPAAISAPTTVATSPIATRAPDLVDRAWPKNPPWDACPRPVWPGVPSSGLPGFGRRVLVIGDSLTRESRALTAKGMRAAGWTPSFRCWGSRRLDWGIDQVMRARGLRQLPRYVIVALGTNDISWETPTTTERRMKALLDRLGPEREVIWVDLHLTRSAWLNARADWFNGLLRRLERQRPNLTVVDWHKVARGHGIRGFDGIHYGPYGYRLRAKTVLAALNAVGRATPPTVSVEATK